MPAPAPLLSSLVTFLVASVIFGILDAVWLGIAARKFYAEALGRLRSETVNVAAATTFYVLYMAGLTHFVIFPAASEQALTVGALNGLFFGAVCYGTWSLTNVAVVKSFSVRLAIVDIAWGAFASAVTTTATCFVVSSFL